MTFYVGQKVVFIIDSKDGVDPRMLPGGHYVPNWPVKGTVYTVREVELRLGPPHLRLEEIINPPRQFANGIYAEACFRASRFRPLVERKSDVSFTMGADPESEKLDNRKKVRTRVRDRRSPVRF